MNTSSPQLAVAEVTSPARDWAIAVAALIIGLCGFGLIFRPEIEAAIQVWRNSDAYSHCFLVLPVAAYLAWDRRDAEMANFPRPAPWIAMLTLPVGAGWLVAERLGLMEARQLMAITLFQVMVAALLGSRAWRALSAPLLYLFFLVPFGEFLVPPLQTLAVHFTTTGLNLSGIPNFADGITIQIPEGTFFVHEACSGLRFLVATMAFAVLFACLVYSSPLRRVLFIALAFAIAVVGNDVRVLGIIFVAHFIGNAQAAVAGHVLWGWLFYLLVGVVLVLFGWRFRQERPLAVRAEPLASGRTAGASIIALAAIMMLATMPRLAASQLDEIVAAKAVTAPIEAPGLPGCSIVPLTATPLVPNIEDTAAAGDGTSHSSTYRCGDDLFVLTLRQYRPRIGVRPLFSSLRAAEALPDADILQTEDVRAGTSPGALAWRVTESEKDGRYRAVAMALWIAGRPAGPGISARVNQVLNTMRRSPIPPVLIVITYSGGKDQVYARRVVDDFLHKTTAFSEFVTQSLSGFHSASSRR